MEVTFGLNLKYRIEERDPESTARWCGRMEGMDCPKVESIDKLEIEEFKGYSFQQYKAKLVENK